jgi:hypothetical protein
MAIRATVVADGTDIMLGSSMDPVSQAVFDQLYQDCAAGILKCREHDDDPACRDHRSEDGRVHGAWLYLQNGTTAERFWPATTQPMSASDCHRMRSASA